MFATATVFPGAVRALLVDSGSPEAHGGRVVVFFAGFMVSPWSYRSLFASIVSDQISIVAPQMYRRGPGPLIGRPSAIQDMLDDRPAKALRRMCGGSTDAAHERSTVANLVRTFIEPG